MPRLVASLLVLVFTAPAVAQGFQNVSIQVNPAKQPVAPITTLRTGTKLVIVDVTVTDQRHNPVHGMKASDFTLLENNKVQTVKSFEEHTAPTAAELQLIPPMPKMPAGVFTNFTPARTIAANGPVNILLIDRLNTPMLAQNNLRNQVMDYLKKAKPGRRIAIFSLTTQLAMLQGFTDDPELLRAVLDKKSNAKASPLLDDAVGGGDVIDDEMTRTPIAAAVMFDAMISASGKMDRGRRTLEAMNVLARYLVGIPGRKNLVWFSGSFPLNILPDTNPADLTGDFKTIDDSDAAFRETISLLSRAQVAVYPVDARGGVTSECFSAAKQAWCKPKDFLDEEEQWFDENTTMRDLAYETGGRAFLNDNDLEGAVADALEDGSSYYTLTYTPTNVDWRGDFRKIKVKLREEGLELNYRRGYYADDPDAPPSSWAKMASGRAVTSSLPVPSQGFSAMRAAMLHGGPDPTQIVFSVEALPMSAMTEDALSAANEGSKMAKGPYRRYSLTFATNPRELRFTDTADGGHHGAVEFITFVYTQDGERVNSLENVVRMNLTKTQYTNAQQHNMVFHQQVSVPAKGEYFLRVAVHDLQNDHVGAVEVPVSSVRNLTSVRLSGSAPAPSPK